ncbi:MAG: pirin family protein [Actinomycetota bacterium]|nr:pirin family protein [Actinomycetota bacterium]
MPIEVRRAEDRFLARDGGHTTWHSFSFGPHYDRHNVGFGALVAHNDELLPPGTGYPEHPHRDTEIVTIVLAGALAHRDTGGHAGILHPGQVQLLSAGSGVVHEERSGSGEPTRFLQMWLRPDEAGLVPSYATAAVDGVEDRLVCVAAGVGSGWAGTGVPVHTRGTSMHVGRLGSGTALALPNAPRLHVFVVSGALTIGDRLLTDGAAGRLVDQGGRQVSATEALTELVVWALR